MIVLSDASIMIDLECVGAVLLLPSLCECEILEVVLEEYKSPKQPDLVERILNSGIKVVHADMEILDKALRVKAEGLSEPDKMIYVYASETDRTVLTGDKALREVCENNSINCHGLIWLMENFVECGLVEPAEICRWIPIISKMGRRLPPVELQRLRTKLNC